MPNIRPAYATFMNTRAGRSRKALSGKALCSGFHDFWCEPRQNQAVKWNCVSIGKFIVLIGSIELNARKFLSR